ncbi:MAG: hypothetical protein AAGB51_00465 [Planctomycetota bacterium]
MATSSSFETGTPGGVCAASGETLTPGTPITSALVEDEAGNVSRLDFSAAAWSGGSRPGDGLVLIGSWRTVVPEAGKRRDPLASSGEIMELFEQLESATEQRRLAFRFALALILIRKKELRLEGGRDQEDGGRAMLVRPRGVALPPEMGGDGPAFIEVVDPKLDEASIAGLIGDLDAVLAPEATEGLA